MTFVGFADELTALDDVHIRHVDDVHEALEALDARRRRQQSACASGGFDSVRSGRIAMPDARLWAPDFLVLSGVPDADDVNRLAALAADPRSAVGILVVGDVPTAAARCTVGADGQLRSRPLGIDVLAHRLDTDHYRDALAVYDAEVAKSTTGASVSADRTATDVDPDEPADVVVSVLGPVEVVAANDVDDERRDLLTELVVYLAVHPDGVHPNVMSGAIWPRGVDDDVRDAALADAAQWLGVDADGEPRLRIHDGRWTLSRSGVRVDWDVFRSLANRAADAGQPLDDLEAALALVRGTVWTTLPAGRYGWLAYESLEADMRVAVVAIARHTATVAVDADDPLRARGALLSGLRLAPSCEPIWRDALRLANRFAGTSDVTAVADDMYVAIARYGSPRGAEAETDAVVDQLVPGYRRSAA